MINTFEFEPEENKKKINVVLTKFDDYRSPRKNTSFERFEFWNQSQQEGETINQFVIALKRMIKNYEYTESTTQSTQNPGSLDCLEFEMQKFRANCCA